ncbi:MAG: potassium/proton antiporter [Lactobacillales bacterium]|jgi:cell volume regulation protein A|nr:potassium/proton antiporter [Lactobacillales bacterium]
MDFINFPILIFSLLLCVSILTSLVSRRMGVPLILLFLFMGLAIGSGGFELLHGLRHPKIAFFIGSVALALILFDSGFHTKMNYYRLTAKASFVLATAGVFLTTVFLAPISHYILHIGWIPALLLAAIISSTDAAAVFFLLRSKGIALREKVKSTLEIESGTNDPMAIFLTLSFITLMQQQMRGESADFSFLLPSFLGQLFIGAGAGYLMAKTIYFLVTRIRLESALYPIFLLGMALLGFAITNMLGGSGFLAVYIAGIILGNSRMPSLAQISKFQQTVAWLSQILMFTSLGIFVTFDGLKEVFVPALIIGFGLMFLVRPAMIFALLAFFKNYALKEKIFISFVGLRGATSILLALAPIVYGLDHADMFFNVVFVMVIISLGCQGYLIPKMARWCDVAVPVKQQEPETAEIDLPGLYGSSLVVYELLESTPVLNGTAIPRWAKPTLVVRDGIAYPSGSVLERLKVGDYVYIFSPSQTRRPFLDKLYGGGEIVDAPDVLGDFAVTPNMTFAELEKIYNIPVDARVREMTIAQLMKQELTDIEIGDRLSLDAVDLVVRSVKDKEVASVGLDVDPSRKRSVQTRTYSLKSLFKKS